METSMGTVFGQSVNLQFAENSFSSILQSIKMVFSLMWEKWIAVRSKWKETIQKKKALVQ